MRTSILLLPIFGLAGLTACTAPPSEEPAPASSPSAAAPMGECRPEAATALVGQVLPGDDEVKALTGATIVRVAGPDDALTQDLRIERVTIIVDPKTKKIVQAGCN